MMIETYQTFEQLISVLKKEKAKQFSVIEEDGEWIYSRPVQYVKVNMVKVKNNSTNIKEEE